MNKKATLVIMCALLLITSGCTADDPLDDIYTQNLYSGSTGNYSIGNPDNPYTSGYIEDLYIWDGNVWILVNDNLGGAPGASSIDWRGAYNPVATYAEYDAVSYNGSSYLCVQASTGNLPTNAAFWGLLAQMGNQGLQGPAGQDGNDGAQGIQGPAGTAGTPGLQGPAGADGEDGTPGLQGPAGADGEDGAQGLQGPAGADGEDGAAGATGDTGAKGDTGAQGPAGAGYNIVKLGSAQTTTSASFVDLTGLSFAVEANSTYVATAYIPFASDKTTYGVGFSINGPASPVLALHQTSIPTTTVARYLQNGIGYNLPNATSPSVQVANTTYLAIMEIYITTGSTAGTLQIRWRSENTLGTMTAQAGAVIFWSKLP